MVLGVLTRRPPLVRFLRQFLLLPLLPEVREEVPRSGKHKASPGPGRGRCSKSPHRGTSLSSKWRGFHK